MIESICPRCDGNIGLNCGDTKEDVYYFMNPNMDERYYNY